MSASPQEVLGGVNLVSGSGGGPSVSKTVVSRGKEYRLHGDSARAGIASAIIALTNANTEHTAKVALVELAIATIHSDKVSLKLSLDNILDMSESESTTGAVQSTLKALEAKQEAANRMSALLADLKRNNIDTSIISVTDAIAEVVGGEQLANKKAEELAAAAAKQGAKQKTPVKPANRVEVNPDSKKSSPVGKKQKTKAGHHQVKVGIEPKDEAGESRYMRALSSVFPPPPGSGEVRAGG